SWRKTSSFRRKNSILQELQAFQQDFQLELLREKEQSTVASWRELAAAVGCAQSPESEASLRLQLLESSVTAAAAEVAVEATERALRADKALIDTRKE
ncbi:unnamed protein product, partial [Polarella glacialis]